MIEEVCVDNDDDDEGDGDDVGWWWWCAATVDDDMVWWLTLAYDPNLSDNLQIINNFSCLILYYSESITH